MNSAADRSGKVLAAVLATVVVGFVFVETAYPALRERVKTLLGRESSSYSPRADLRNPEAQEVLKQRTLEILAERDSALSQAEQLEIMGLWHELEIWQNMWFLGIRIQKNPCDLWMMQQVMFEVRPDYVIEAGTAYGGSALYFAHVLDGLGLEDSKVITFDIEDRCADARRQPLWQHYVEFVHASSTDAGEVAKLAERTAGKKVLVCLDSWHADHHVLAELRAYAPMISPGSYLVVEDTNMDLLGIQPEGASAGPMSAVRTFMDEEGGAELFEADLTREQMILTFNPGGWLKRRGS